MTSPRIHAAHVRVRCDLAPYITPSMVFSSSKGVVRGAAGSNCNLPCMLHTSACGVTSSPRSMFPPLCAPPNRDCPGIEDGGAGQSKYRGKRSKRYCAIYMYSAVHICIVLYAIHVTVLCCIHATCAMRSTCNGTMLYAICPPWNSRYRAHGYIYIYI